MVKCSIDGHQSIISSQLFSSCSNYVLDLRLNRAPNEDYNSKAASYLKKVTHKVSKKGNKRAAANSIVYPGLT